MDVRVTQGRVTIPAENPEDDDTLLESGDYLITDPERGIVKIRATETGARIVDGDLVDGLHTLDPTEGNEPAKKKGLFRS